MTLPRYVCKLYINVNTTNIVPDCSNVSYIIASFATITLLYDPSMILLRYAL